jgi:membrane protease subunit (stomatin/prohibitin family)
MSLFDFAKKQFVDVIQWTEPENGILVYRFPMADMEIQNGASLTVRESQLALFVDEGKAADLFVPGRYTLTTQTLPVLTYLKNWDKFFESPFKSDVYYFSTRLQLDRKWGTPNPITIRDPEFGVVRVRAFGIYAYRMVDPKKFHTEISGTREIYTVDDLDGQLRNTMIAAMTDLFAQSGIAFLDMAANQDELGKRLLEKLQPMFERYGLALDNLVVQNVSLPEELQAVLDQRISMNVVGDLGKYTQFQTAQAIPVAAANEGGVAGMGAGLGVGVGIGQAMGAAMTPSAQADAVAATAAEDIPALLEKLHELTVKGILSVAEFEAKKAELLKKLS